MIMKNNLYAFVAVLVMFTNAMVAQKVKKEKILDGVNYEITLVEENTKKETKAVPDLIKFKSGKLTSRYMEDKFKFEKGDFTFVTDSTDVENKKIHFNCDMVNETNETIKWDGDIEEDIIEGKIFWIKKDKKTKSDVIKKSFSFNGGIQKKR